MDKKPREPDSAENIELNENEARQGIELYEMRYVLIFGAIGAILVLTAAYFYFFFFR